MQKMSFTDGIIQILIELAPLLTVVLVMFVIFSWIRVLADHMSGKGL